MSLTKTIKTEAPTLRRTEVRQILKRHKGSVAQMARDLGVTTTSVSMCLRGKGTSARIETACREKALELLNEEHADAA